MDRLRRELGNDPVPSETRRCGFRIFLLALALASSLAAQNPVTRSGGAKFPTSVVTDSDIFVHRNITGTQAISSTLSSGIDASTLTIPVVSETGFQAGMVITIDSERMFVCSVAASTLTICSGDRGFHGTAAVTHSSAAVISTATAAVTRLASAITAATLSVPVLDASAFLEKMVITIENERLLVCTIAINTLTICAGGRGFDGSFAAAHVANLRVQNFIIAVDLNQAAAEIKAIETELGTGRVKNITAFGATDGGGDDAVAIQAAIDAAPVKGIVYCPPGDYDIGVQLNIVEPLTFRGSGPQSCIIRTTNGTQHAFAVAEDDAVVFENFRLDSTVAKTAGDGIRLDGATGSTVNSYTVIRNVHIFNQFHGFHPVDAANWSIVSSVVHSSDEYGIYAQNTQNIDAGAGKIIGTRIDAGAAGGLSGVRWESGGGLQMHGGKIAGHDRGFDMNHSLTGNTGVLEITGVSIENQVVASLAFTSTSTGNFSQAQIVGNQISSTGASSIAVDMDANTGHFGRFVFDDNTIRSLGPKCVELTGGPNFITFKDNIFGECTTGIDGAGAGVKNVVEGSMFTGVTTPYVTVASLLVRDHSGTTHANLPTLIANGSSFYCSDCIKNSDPCAALGTGAVADRINGAWVCGASGAGEVNTMSNLGSGIGVFETKVGVDLRLNSLADTATIDWSEDDPNDELDAIVIADSITPVHVDETDDYSFTTLSGKQTRNNSAVNDDDCTGEQGAWWYDTTDSAFEFCNANSGAPAVLGGGGGGSSNWEDLINTADTATSYTASATAETVTFTDQSGRSDNFFHVQQNTGNPGGAARLLRVTATDVDILPFLVERAVDGTTIVAALENSQAHAGGSLNEAVRLDFNLGGDTVARIEVGKDDDYVPGPAEDDGHITFFVDQNGTPTEVIRLDSALALIVAGAITEAGNAVPNVTDNLSVFAATTSLQLLGVISDETGSGPLPFSISPNLQGIIDRTGTAVNDDECTGQQGSWWWDSTDSAFEFCNASSGTPTLIGGNSFGVIGTATADTPTDTLTVSDSATIDFTVTNDPEDLTAIVIADSMGTAQIDETEAYVFSALATTTLTGGNLILNDGVGDSPQLQFVPATGTQFNLFVEDTADDFRLTATTASTENVEFENTGTGLLAVFIETADGVLTDLKDATHLTTGIVPVGRVGADHLDAISEIAAGIKRGPDATDTHLLSTDVAAPAGIRCLQMDTDGSTILATDTCANLGPGGTPSLDTVTDPVATKTFTFDATGENLVWSYTSAFGAGIKFGVNQVTGDPTAGTLVDFRAADAQVTVLRAGDGTNGVTVSQAGAMTAEGAGTITATNMTIAKYVYYKAAGCQNTTANTGFDLPTATTPTAACDTTFDTDKTVGVVSFDDTTEEDVTDHFILPPGFTGNIDLFGYWHGTNIVNEVRWCAQIQCVDTGEEPGAFNAATCADETVSGTADRRDDFSRLNLTQTGCSADDELHWRFYREAGDAGDDFVGDAGLVSLRFTIRDAQSQ